MSLRKLDMNLLLVFDAIYRTRNITRAADELSLTQPAVSNALRRLRDYLDDPLFERKGYGVEPTAKARHIAPDIRSAMRALANITETRAFDPSTSTRRFTIVAPDPVDIPVVMPLLRDLLVQAPGITLTMDLPVIDTYAAGLLAKNVDLGIFIQTIQDENISSTFLFSERTCFVVRQDHPVYGDSQTLSMEDLRTAPFVALADDLRKVVHLEQETKAHGHDRRIMCKVRRLWSVPHIVSQSDLMGALPASMAQKLAEPLGLKLLDPPFQLPAQQLYMSWHRDFDADPAHKWLRDKISGLFGSDEHDQG